MDGQLGFTLVGIFFGISERKMHGHIAQFAVYAFFVDDILISARLEYSVEFFSHPDKLVPKLSAKH